MKNLLTCSFWTIALTVAFAVGCKAQPAIEVGPKQSPLLIVTIEQHVDSVFIFTETGAYAGVRVAGNFRVYDPTGKHDGRIITGPTCFFVDGEKVRDKYILGYYFIEPNSSRRK